jgi:hypothetical protein
LVLGDIDWGLLARLPPPTDLFSAIATYEAVASSSEEEVGDWGVDAGAAASGRGVSDVASGSVAAGGGTASVGSAGGGGVVAKYRKPLQTKADRDLGTLVSLRGKAHYKDWTNVHPKKRSSNSQVCIGWLAIVDAAVGRGGNTALPSSCTCHWCHRVFNHLKKNLTAIPDDDPFWVQLESVRKRIPRFNADAEMGDAEAEKDGNVDAVMGDDEAEGKGDGMDVAEAGEDGRDGMEVADADVEATVPGRGRGGKSKKNKVKAETCEEYMALEGRTKHHYQWVPKHKEAQHKKTEGRHPFICGLCKGNPIAAQELGRSKWMRQHSEQKKHILALSKESARVRGEMLECGLCDDDLGPDIEMTSTRCMGYFVSKDTRRIAAISKCVYSTRRWIAFKVKMHRNICCFMDNNGDIGVKCTAKSADDCGNFIPEGDEHFCCLDCLAAAEDGGLVISILKLSFLFDLSVLVCRPGL